MRHDRALYQQFSYSADVCGIIPRTMVLPGEEKTKPVLIGMELECSTDLSIDKIMDAQEEAFFICKSDSSISGSKSGKHEMVTIPMSIAAQKKHWAHWFSNVDLTEFDTSLDTNNGLHIHIDRKAFKEDEESDHLLSFVWLFMNPLNQYFWKIVAEREHRNLEYAKFVSTTGNNSLIKAYRNVLAQTRSLGKYSVVNLSPTKTVEVRLFKGIVSFASVLKCIEVVQAAFDFSLEMSDYSFRGCSLENFIIYLMKSPSSQYPALKSFLETINLDSIRLESLKQQFLFNKVTRGMNPEKLYKELLLHPQFLGSTTFVEVLNSRVGSNILRWNNHSKRIELIQKKTGRLSPLDTLFTQRYTGKIMHKEYKEHLKQRIIVPFSEREVLEGPSYDNDNNDSF